MLMLSPVHMKGSVYQQHATCAKALSAVTKQLVSYLNIFTVANAFFAEAWYSFH